MRVLAFRHVPFEHLGLIAPALDAAGISWEYVDLFRGTEPPGWEDAAGFISMGGPMSANDDLPFLREELRILEGAVRARRPVLGVCLGSQLLARALGARVYPGAKEIGWRPVRFTGAAANDPLFRGFDSPETLFHWHGETFDLPAGAVHLAWSEACRQQAFRYGVNAYGLQFHLEVTPEMIAGWCAEDANAGDVRELDAPLDPHAHAERLRELAALVFGRWAKLAADGGG
jgi:GMP synthase-like glutamine amidotransferase